MTSVKEMVQEAIYAQRDQFVQLAHDIHDHPELAFCEEYAAACLTEFLAEAGFTVSKGICGMPTAFVASFGHGPLHIAFCAEYDALPPACLYDRSKPPDLVEVWLAPERKDAPLLHACGHNLIAGAAVAAAIGLRDIANEVGLTVLVFGTPGEELFGLPEPHDDRLAPGKITLLEGGAFEGVHAALMLHPFPTPWSVFIATKSYSRLRARFSKAGEGGNYLGTPELQRLEQSLKQAILSFNQIPSLFVARPETQNACAQADILWVAPSPPASLPVREAVRRCFQEAAFAAGLTVEIIEYARDAEMRHDPMLSAAYRKNSEVLGRVRGRDEHIQAEIREIFSSSKLPLVIRLVTRYFPRLVSPPGLFMKKFPVDITYGTDLANMSQVIPAIHPYVGIGGTTGPHMAEFADDVDTAEAHRAMLDGAIALAWTAIDAATNLELKTYLLKSASSRVTSRPTMGESNSP